MSLIDFMDESSEMYMELSILESFFRRIKAIFPPNHNEEYQSQKDAIKKKNKYGLLV